MTGDEANLPLRDKGPAKRFIRDYVDARWNVGEFMLPVMVLVLALTFLGNRFPWALMLVFILVYGLILAGVIDAFLMWRRLRARLVAKFGEEPPRGARVVRRDARLPDAPLPDAAPAGRPRGRAPLSPGTWARPVARRAHLARTGPAPGGWDRPGSPQRSVGQRPDRLLERPQVRRHVRDAGGRRHQGHVVERRHQHAPVGQRDVQVVVELGVVGLVRLRAVRPAAAA